MSACCPLALAKEGHTETDIGTSVARKPGPTCKTMQLLRGCKQGHFLSPSRLCLRWALGLACADPALCKGVLQTQPACQHSLKATSRETRPGLAFSLFLNIWAVTGVKLHQPSNNSDLFECQLCVFLQHWASAWTHHLGEKYVVKAYSF